MADEIEVTEGSDRQMRHGKYGPRAADQPPGMAITSYSTHSRRVFELP